MFGPFSASVDGTEVDLGGLTALPRKFLAVGAVESCRAKSVAVDQIGEPVWGHWDERLGKPFKSTTNAVRNHLFGPAAANHPARRSAIHRRGHQFKVEADVDLKSFLELVEAADFESALGIAAAGDFQLLSDLSESEFYGDWLRTRRGEFAQQVTDCFAGLEAMGVVDEERVLRMRVQFAEAKGDAASAAAFREQLSKLTAISKPHRVEPMTKALGEKPEPTDVIAIASIPRKLSNLPAATYAEFVEREVPEQKILAALRTRLPVVALVGIGGVGKSTLARETAWRLRHGELDSDDYVATVWISDKPRPGSTGLEDVLRIIATTLGYPGSQSGPIESQTHEIHSILERHTAVIVIDNFETIEDPRIVEWLADLPEPCKAIVTTKRLPSSLKEISTEIRLEGMNQAEMARFLDSLRSRLDFEGLDDALIDEAVEICKGNPKAVELALGFLRRTPRSGSDAIRELKSHPDEIFNELFEWSYELLGKDARALLLATHLFPFGADPPALAHVAGVPLEEQDWAIEDLVDSMLADLTRPTRDTAPTVSVHPLVSALVDARFEEESTSGIEMRRRWLDYNVALAQGIGHCPDALDRLNVLDPPGRRENLIVAAEWAIENEHFRDAIEIGRGSFYYYYVRGIWSVEHSPNLIRAGGARAIGDVQEEFDALTLHVNIAAKQDDSDEAERHLPRLHELEGKLPADSPSLAKFRHAEALCCLANGKYGLAEEIWRELLDSSEDRGADYSAQTRWLANCIKRQEGRSTEAKKMLEDAMEHAVEHSLPRAKVATRLLLIEIDLDDDQIANAKSALKKLSESKTMRADLAYLGDFEFQMYRLELAQNRPSDARNHLLNALDIYERLGSRRKTQRSRDELARPWVGTDA